MNALFAVFADPGFRTGWMIASIVVLVAPMAWLSWFYHTRIKRTAGGRALMKRQDAAQPRAGDAKLADAADMARDIKAGRYGDDAKRLQTIAYAVAGAWALACAVMFGLLIAADAVNAAG